MAFYRACQKSLVRIKINTWDVENRLSGSMHHSVRCLCSEVPICCPNVFEIKYS
jgi:hypothetical protein